MCQYSCRDIYAEPVIRSTRLVTTSDTARGRRRTDDTTKLSPIFWGRSASLTQNTLPVRSRPWLATYHENATDLSPSGLAWCADAADRGSARSRFRATGGDLAGVVGRFRRRGAGRARRRQRPRLGGRRGPLPPGQRPRFAGRRGAGLD